jgi:hypothetical protein
MARPTAEASASYAIGTSPVHGGADAGIDSAPLPALGPRARCTISVALEMDEHILQQRRNRLTQGCGDGPAFFSHPERQTI